MSADPKAPEPGRAPASPLSLPRITDGERERIGGFVEAVNAEPPATPEPAAPMPRVSPEPRVSNDEVANILRHERHEGSAASGRGAIIPMLAFDLRAERAKVAELEARIADIHEALGENAGSDDASLPASIRWTLADHRNALEESEAALARANEALTRSRAFVHYGCSCGEGITDGRCARMNAQGSAAQKPEGPQ